MTAVVSGKNVGGKDGFWLIIRPRAANNSQTMSKESQITGFFKPGGQFSSVFKGYEHRPQQVEMAQAVASAIGGRKHLVVEAGTGVGKSLAYLLPAYLHARQTGEPVVVSTYTINLQEQLLEKDIPLLVEALGVDVKAAVAKGRRNYLCLRRLRATGRSQMRLFEDDETYRQLRYIQDWSLATKDGSLSDLDFVPSPELWEQVNSSRYICTGKSCVMSEMCFFRRARQRLRQAQLVVANHYLYFSDLATPESAQQVLPPHNCVIFDEAHTLESVASECLGLLVSRRTLAHLLEMLAGSERRRGILQRTLGGELLPAAAGLKKTASAFFDSIEEWSRDGLPPNMRIREPVPLENTLSEPMRRLSASLVKSSVEMEDEDTASEIKGYAAQLLENAEAIEIIRSLSLKGQVYWIEKGSRDLSLRCAPVRVSGLLPQVLFSRLATSVLTGATLAVGKRDPFAFLRDRLGLEAFHELKLGSPFDYPAQATIYVEKDLPPPASEDYVAAISQASKDYLKKSEGRALVLFTNYGHLKDVAGRLADFLEEQGWSVLVQGAGVSRLKMLETFREETNSVLFGTSSFWQGIDVPGESLSNVIITRLPFEVPTIPLQQARLEELAVRGQDPFQTYSLPQAVIRLKQGVGRLIRSRSDRGMIVILDSRVASRPYGKTFLESLPPCKIVTD